MLNACEASPDPPSKQEILHFVQEDRAKGYMAFHFDTASSLKSNSQRIMIFTMRYVASK